VEEPQAIGLQVKGENAKKKVEVKSKEWGHVRKECLENLKG
jgi:hypothetical protein